jgi:phage-related protein
MSFMTQPSPKPVIWLGDTLATLRACPQEVQDEVGHALYLAQIGAKYKGASRSRALALAYLRSSLIIGATPIGP